MREKPFMDEFMIQACRLPGVKVWRQNAGNILVFDPETKIKRCIRGLPKGAADVGGIFRPGGRVLQIETKAPKKGPTPDQRRWGAMITAYGGLWIAAKPTEELDVETNALQWAQRLFRILTQ